MSRAETIAPVEPEASSPLVAAATESLARRIRSGDLGRGKSLPSERDLASYLGVSRTIVRAAMIELQQRGMIVCKPRCRPVVAGPSVDATSGYVALSLWPNTDHFGESLILRGIRSGTPNSSLRFQVANAGGDSWDAIVDSEASFLQGIAQDPSALGLIIWYLGGETNRHALERVRAAGKPIIFVDRQAPAGFQADFVGTDSFWSAQAAAQHLLDLGHRRLLCISNRDRVSAVKEREAGFQRALRDAGLPQGEVSRVSTDEDDNVLRMLDELLDGPEGPTALFCVNDLIAFHALEALSQRGLTVPGDVSVVGFDDLLRWLPGGGTLTTCTQDFIRIGQLAIELMLTRIAERDGHVYRHVLLNAPLNVRSSTAPPKQSTHRREAIL